jgi:hypothetical protein
MKYRVWVDGESCAKDAREVRTGNATLAAELCCEFWESRRWKGKLPQPVTLWVAPTVGPVVKVRVKPSLTIQWDGTEVEE